MRFLATSDWHLDWSTAGVARWADLEHAVDETVLAAVANRVDCFLFLGDLTDPDSVRSHRAVAKAIETAVRLMEKGIASRWLVGNHDVIEDGSGASTITPIGAAGSVPVNGEPPMIAAYAEPCIEIVHDTRIVALPFTPRSHTYDPDAFVRSLVPDTRPTLVLGHLNIEGITAGSETEDMPRGRDVFFPLDACKERLPNASLLNGHYHKRQTFRGIHIPGSLERLTFGEEQNEPGYLILEVQ